MKGTEPPDYLLAMVRRSPPRGTPVVPGSTPVVSFGDANHAAVATLGINPSANEFLDGSQLLEGAHRRLATLSSLGADSLDELTNAQVADVVADCAAYFQRRPYRRWFDPLDALLQAGTGASYYDGSACHLDLAQWATRPIWGRIVDRAARRALLDDGVPHLKAQLAAEQIGLVLLNGRQVVAQVTGAGLVELEPVGRITVGAVSSDLFVGSSENQSYVGWSANIQSSWGVSTQFKDELAAWIAGISRSTPSPTSVGGVGSTGIDVTGHLPRSLELSGKRELIGVLERWLAESHAATIGDVGRYGGKAWVSVLLSGYEIVLNADTRRDAIQRFVKANKEQLDTPWRVVANSRGRINKVLPTGRVEECPGWYAYLNPSLDEEGIV